MCIVYRCVHALHTSTITLVPVLDGKHTRQPHRRACTWENSALSVAGGCHSNVDAAGTRCVHRLWVSECVFVCIPVLCVSTVSSNVSACACVCVSVSHKCVPGVRMSVC